MTWKPWIHLLVLLVLQHKCCLAIQTLVDAVKTLQKRGNLTLAQRDSIVQNLTGDELPMMMLHHRNHSVLSREQEELLHDYFQEEEENGRMTRDIRYYLSTLFRFQPRSANVNSLRSGSTQKSVSSLPEFTLSYDDGSSTGIVELLGHYRNHDYADDPSFPHYRGIWGFALDEEEYALLTDIKGLHIINVTDATMPVLVKYIELEDLLYPVTVRDVDVYVDDAENAVYAYVAAQNYYAAGRLTVINVTGILLMNQDDNNIDPFVVNRGRKEYGHTVTVSHGLLLLNSANFAEEYGVFGCQIFDLVADPWNPPLVGIYTRGDCHDTTLHRLRIDEEDEEDRLVLISADGNNGRWAFLDVQGLIEDYAMWSSANSIVRQSNSCNSNSFFADDECDYYESSWSVLYGLTPLFEIFQYAYAHSHVLDEDTMLLYCFEESNEFDFVIFNVTNLNKPVLEIIYKHDPNRHDSVVHNGHLVKHNGKTFLAIAYYSAGFRVWDVTDVDAIREVGHYDTIQNLYDKNTIGPDDLFSNLEEFYENPFGAWNLYAGLPTGHLLVSDLQQGLYILNLTTDGDGVGQPESMLPTVAPITTPTLAPSKAPTTAPSKAPTTAPTTTSTITAAPTDLLQMLVVIYTDQFPSETGWQMEVINATTNSTTRIIYGEILDQNVEPLSKVTKILGLTEGERYRFRVTDIFEDGFCKFVSK